MSSRFSRPRTRIYDSNYNLGENYYRSALDRLDRKYSGKLSPQPSSGLTPPRQSSASRDILLDHDESLSDARRRAEKHITERHLFDSRGGRIFDQLSNDGATDALEEDIVLQLKRLRAAKKVSMIDDVDLQNTVDNLSAKRLFERTDKMLHSVGLMDEVPELPDQMNRTIRRRHLRIVNGERRDGLSDDWAHWLPLADENGGTAAEHRARRTKERLANLEDEMAAITEKQAARERRAARLKAFVAENLEDSEAAQSALKSITSTTLKSRHVRTSDTN